MPLHHPDGRPDLSRRCFQLDHLSAGKSKPLCGRRRHQCRVVPSQSSQRPRQFLKPAIVGVAPIPQPRVGPEQRRQRIPAGRRGRGQPLLQPGQHLTCHRRSLAAAHDPLPDGIRPEGLGIRLAPPLGFPHPGFADDRIAIRARLAAQHRQQLVRGPAVPQRAQLRLKDRHRPVEGPRIAPPFELMRFWHVPGAEISRLIDMGPKMHRKRDLPQRRAEPQVRRSREHRVAPQDHQRIDRTGLHVADKLRQRCRMVHRLGLDRVDMGQGSVQRFVDRVDQRMHRSGQRRPGMDQRRSPVALQIARDRRDPGRRHRKRHSSGPMPSSAASALTAASTSSGLATNRWSARAPASVGMLSTA